MATVTVENLLAKVPDAQFCAGDVIAHVGSKNVVIGQHIAGGAVVLTPAGDAMLADPAADAAPKKKKADAAV